MTFIGSNPILTTKLKTNKQKQINMEEMEDLDFSKLQRIHRNMMIQALLAGALYGLIVGFGLGLYC